MKVYIVLQHIYAETYYDSVFLTREEAEAQLFACNLCEDTEYDDFNNYTIMEMDLPSKPHKLPVRMGRLGLKFTFEDEDIEEGHIELLDVDEEWSYKIKRELVNGNDTTTIITTVDYDPQQSASDLRKDIINKMLKRFKGE